MSEYSPIGDHEEPAHKEHSYSSHPYMTGYGNAQGQRRPEADVINVAPPAGEYLQSSAGPSTFNSQDGGQRISRYETSLSLRYDVEAALAYVLGVFSGAVLLVVEKKNDYVRFHAWQSSLLSAAVFFALVVTALISNFLYWVVLLGTIGLSGYMARRAYLDGAVFERFMLPYVGLLAAQFVDEE
ncbi:hypothetical protein LPJ78_000702 [Coemansia sp. RSA 989]|nr:hypothetical protein BX667DRAFT_495983 [Coemansia mojavensis]KAJ1744092.1 hypothetical protein LPJ68_000322 [Coemansia sp. RSA 1086]KAJ1752647.1 hypothetical protein LPJ79_001033 [Coemansia sp. RSA 1821]KAJ1867830.1 hypothetical protein LPJ78_000702 [Coemansia sp. RSA 989]KAJ1874681.1 hypothetical protein LPJ55_001288 [Coemansia sp. RSA 990]KAJ2673712.1 hypothetical protein IWW42_002124 [Coemansia sp. RSA 1085]